MSFTLIVYRPVKIGAKMSQKRKKSYQTGNSFILFFKWYFITLNFRALKNLAGMCRNFEKKGCQNQFSSNIFFNPVIVR